MTFSKFVLAGAAALALVACGKKNDGAAGAAKTSAASPLETQFQLKAGEPLDVDALFALAPEGKRPTYDSAKFDKKLGATVVANLRFADADDGESLLVERAEFYGVDLSVFERAKDAGGAPDAPFETAFEKVRLLNVSAQGFDNNAGDFTVGGIEFDKLDIRRGGMAGDGADKGPARFFNAVNLGGLYFKDLKVETKNAEAPAIVTLAPDLRFVGLGGGKLSSIIANDLEYKITQSDASLAAMSQAMGPQGAMLLNGPLRAFVAPNNQRVAIKSFEWRGIDLSGLLQWGLKGEKPPATARDLIDLGAIKALGMETFIDGRRVGAVKEATVSAAKFTWLAPSHIRADAKGATTDFTAYVPETETAVLNVLKEYKLENVPSDGNAEWIWNTDSGAADLRYAAAAKGLADFSLDLGLNGVKLADIAAAQGEGAENAFVANAALRGLSVKIRDEKALDVLFALSALQMGGTAADMRQAAPAMIRLSGAQMAMEIPKMGEYVEAIASFVAEGGTLEITAAPEAPVTFAALQAAGASAPQSVPDLLNLTVTHKK